MIQLALVLKRADAAVMVVAEILAENAAVRVALAAGTETVIQTGIAVLADVKETMPVLMFILLQSAHREQVLQDFTNRKNLQRLNAFNKS